MLHQEDQSDVLFEFEFEVSVFVYVVGSEYHEEDADREMEDPCWDEDSSAPGRHLGYHFEGISIGKSVFDSVYQVVD